MKNRSRIHWWSLLVLIGIYPMLASCGSSDANAPPRNPIGPPRLEPVLTGLDNPVFVTNARDGRNRLFIVEQPGRIKVLSPGSNAPTIYLDLSARVLYGGERGLLGLAFHPQFRANRRFFVNYTRRPDGATVIAEYQQSSGNAGIALVNETVLLTVNQPFENHNGGMLAFGRDGFLYIGMGDGGSGNDPGNRAQNPNELLGKILRIDVNPAGASAPYTSPSDNPYFGSTAGREEIYAVGLRNPWRFSFDRQTGELYVGDVGQGAREEIDLVTRGGNYGWRVREGAVCTDLDPALCDSPDLIPPILDYDHANGRCSVTGGYVYRGNSGTLPQGSYVYGDFCSGEIFVRQNDTPQLLMDTNLNISAFGEDESGELYVVNLSGTLSRFVPGN